VFRLSMVGANANTETQFYLGSGHGAVRPTECA
jgi:hypothetical protein